MSFHHVSAAMKWSDERGSARLVLLVLAHHANDQNESYPSIATISEEARIGRSTALETLRKMVESGAIKRVGPHPDARWKGTIVYRLPDPWTRPDSGPVQVEDEQEALPVQGGLSDPSRSRTQKELQTTIEKETIKIAGKPVDLGCWASTVAVLEVYNEATRGRLRAVKGDGSPSEAAKRVYGAVRGWPDLTLERHREIIERTLASKWWGDGPPSIGVVYGPKIFETNIERSATAGNGRVLRLEHSTADLSIYDSTTQEG